MIKRLEDLKEGFYIANLTHLNDQRDLLCYVFKGDGEPSVKFPWTGPFPVVLENKDGPSYVLLSELRPTNPSEELDDAQTMIEFIYTNQRRLQEVRRLEQQAQSAQSSPSCKLPSRLEADCHLRVLGMRTTGQNP